MESKAESKDYYKTRTEAEEQSFLKAFEILEEKLRSIMKFEDKPDIDNSNNNADWRVGKYYISDTFEVIQYHGCEFAQDALIGKASNYEDALKILHERTIDWILTDKRNINDILYFHYVPK